MGEGEDEGEGPIENEDEGRGRARERLAEERFRVRGAFNCMVTAETPNRFAGLFVRDDALLRKLSLSFFIFIPALIFNHLQNTSLATERGLMGEEAVEVLAVAGDFGRANLRGFSSGA